VEDDIWLMEMTTKLSGVILKKALLEENFEKVYKRVFEQISVKVFEDDMNILEILGNVGG
jgi:hypothetical protein